MPELRLIANRGIGYQYSPQDGEKISAPERELRDFIRAVTELFGPCMTGVLTEIWLNEVACMDCTPGSGSFDWRIVSLAASTNLASQLIASQLHPDVDSKNFTARKEHDKSEV
jgi:hypothetical protein